MFNLLVISGIALTGGSSFAPGGIGVQFGEEVGRFEPYAGVGLLSKGNELGHPLVAGTKIMLNDSLFVDLALSRFSGSGVRSVLFHGSEAGTGVHRVRADWALGYGHGGLGITTWQDAEFRLTLEAGFALNVYSRIGVAGADEQRFGTPQQIILKDDVRVAGMRFGAGERDFGPFVSVALHYAVDRVEGGGDG